MVFEVNPCSPWPTHGDVISYNRYTMVAFLAADVLLILLLRFFTVIHHEQDVTVQEAIAKKKSELKAIGEGGFGNSKTIREIHIEDIQDMVFAEASLATLKPRKVGKRIQRKCEPMKLIQQFSKSIDTKTKAQKESDSSSEEESEEENHKKTQHKKWKLVSVRGLKLDASELSDMMNSTLGHKHICIALVMLHFPYSYAGIICLLHFLALTTLIAYRMSSPVVSAKVVTVIKVLQYLLNIVLLCLSILGINSQSLWLHTQTCF